jgi:hypothetical protein
MVALTSVKGAPGVTTTALALASVWPAGRRVIVVEADPAGGDIAARFGLPADPSVVTLATSLRHERASAAGAILIECCQQLPGGLAVLVEPISPTEARSALDMVADSLAGLAVDGEVDVIIDCGRIYAGVVASTSGEPGVWRDASPVTRLLRRADSVLLISGGELADLGHVQAQLPALLALNSNLHLVLRPPQSWPNDEIERELDLSTLGTLPSDSVAADVLSGREHGRRVDRLPLFRGAKSIAECVFVPPRAVASDIEAPARDETEMTALRPGGVPAQ